MSTTDLTKPVKRRSLNTIRDRSKRKRIVITLYPAGHIGLRLEKNHQEETIPLEAIWSLAVKMRVAQERADKKKAKANKW